jgi:hypothetical protein
VRDIAESRYNVSVSINDLAKAVHYPRCRVKAALEHGMDLPGQRGKHIALNDDRERQISDWIGQNAERETPFITREIRDYCISSQEEQRLQVPRVFQERTIQELNEYVQRCRAELP